MSGQKSDATGVGTQPSAEEIEKFASLLHCSTGGFTDFPTQVRKYDAVGSLDLSEARAKDPDFDEKFIQTDSEGNKILPWEFAEHQYIGNFLKLRFPNATPVTALNRKFTLSSGIQLTYGQINAMAGDFYGPTSPICMETTPQGRAGRFREGWGYLDGESKEKTQELIDITQGEVDSFNSAVRDGKPEEAYPKGFWAGVKSQYVSAQLQWWSRNHQGPNYLRLALMNLDHFGEDALTAWKTGHQIACEEAAAGTPDKLESAYKLNAFADHFLEDIFAAGHMRVPRRVLHEKQILIGGDKAAQNMHEEDGDHGLKVVNKYQPTTPWKALGDQHLLSSDNQDNVLRLSWALQRSVDDVWDSFSNKKAVTVYKSLDYVVDFNASFGPNSTLGNFAPMYDKNGNERTGPGPS